jgi:hypothetical protein
LQGCYPDAWVSVTKHSRLNHKHSWIVIWWNLIKVLPVNISKEPDCAFIFWLAVLLFTVIAQISTPLNWIVFRIPQSYFHLFTHKSHKRSKNFSCHEKIKQFSPFSISLIYFLSVLVKTLTVNIICCICSMDHYILCFAD